MTETAQKARNEAIDLAEKAHPFRGGSSHLEGFKPGGDDFRGFLGQI